MSTSALICDAIRTPIGRYGGSLSGVRTDDLAAHPLSELLRRNPQMNPEQVEEVFLGCANQAGEDNRNVARMASLIAGLPQTVPGVTVNRLCASGLEAVGSAARAVRCGEIGLAIAGGVEGMTRAPFVMGKADSAFGRKQELQDTTMGWRFVNPTIERRYGAEAMPQTAENVARQFSVTRPDQDAFALRSQQRAAAAQKRNFFAAEIASIEVPAGKRGKARSFYQDEHPRSDTTLESLAALRPLFGDGGTVTAGNASGINDGAAAMIIANEATAKRNGLTPIARIIGMASAGVDPSVMGIGPVPAVRKLLEILNLKIESFDAIELNEAFASQAVAVLRALNLPDDAEQVNPNGGAIALGHPLGMSGTRLVMTLVHQLEETGGRLGLATLCVGVGMGLALAVERV